MSFTTVGFSSWNKATERFNNHVDTGSSPHQACTISWKSFMVAQSKGMNQQLYTDVHILEDCLLLLFAAMKELINSP